MNDIRTIDDIPSIVLKDGTFYTPTSEDVFMLVTSYPEKDVIKCLRAMAGWSWAHESRRKTKRGIKRFMNGWVSRQADVCESKSNKAFIERHTNVGWAENV